MGRLVLPVGESFRLKVSHKRRRAFWSVYITPTIQSMREAVRDTYRAVGDPPDLDVERLTACAFGCEWHDGPYRHCHGILFFHEGESGPAVVAHELAHAAFRTCERWDINPRRGRTERLVIQQKSGEEAYCQIMEQLNGEFWRACRNRADVA